MVIDFGEMGVGFGLVGGPEKSGFKKNCLNVIGRKVWGFGTFLFRV